MTKEEYTKNHIPKIKNNNENKSDSNKENKNNINENICVKINNIKGNINLNDIKKCLSNFILPLFIDINRNDKIIILRFESKKESDLFIEKVKEKSFEDLKEIINMNENNNKNIVEELNEEERKKYLQSVKKEI